MPASRSAILPIPALIILLAAIGLAVFFTRDPGALSWDQAFYLSLSGGGLCFIAWILLPAYGAGLARGLLQSAGIALALPVVIALYGPDLAQTFDSPPKAVFGTLRTAIQVLWGAPSRHFFAALAPLVLIPIALWFAASDLLAAPLAGPARGQGKRRRARSDLHGDSDFMSKRDMGRIAKSRTGLILGTYRRFGFRKLMIYPLNGSVLTYAPPRMGKTACKILNYLCPDGRGHQGPIVDIDPRGEAFCVAARERRMIGRVVILIDPFGQIAAHKARWGEEVWLPDVYCTSESYNPLDLIRAGEEMVGDIDGLLDALLEPPLTEAGNARHFYASMRTLLRGVIAWVRFREDPEKRTLHHLLEILTTDPANMSSVIKTMTRDKKDLCGLPYVAGSVLARVSQGEGGSNFTTYVNALSWLAYPQIERAMRTSSFDPAWLCDDRMDIFIVVPEAHIKNVGGFMRLWALIPNILTDRKTPVAPILAVIDEMAAIGRLDRLVDTFNMAAGKGLHYWTITQTESSFDRTYGSTTRRVINDLADVVQILGVPRENKSFAENISAAIGHATFEQTAVSQGASGRSTGPDPLAGRDSLTTQDGNQISLVKGAVMSPEAIMQMPYTGQIVLANPRQTTRKHALYLQKANYWELIDCQVSADPNPYVLAKQAGKKR